MFAAVQRASQTWQRVAITDFERKQLITLREELNAQFDGKASPGKPRIPLTNSQHFEDLTATPRKVRVIRGW